MFLKVDCSVWGAWGRRMVIDFLEGLAMLLDGAMVRVLGYGWVCLFLAHLLLWDGGNVFILILNRILNLAQIEAKGKCGNLGSGNGSERRVRERGGELMLLDLFGCWWCLVCRIIVMLLVEHVFAFLLWITKLEAVVLFHYSYDTLLKTIDSFFI